MDLNSVIGGLNIITGIDNIGVDFLLSAQTFKERLFLLFAARCRNNCLILARSTLAVIFLLYAQVGAFRYKGEPFPSLSYLLYKVYPNEHQFRVGIYLFKTIHGRLNTDEADLEVCAVLLIVRWQKRNAAITTPLVTISSLRK